MKTCKNGHENDDSLTVCSECGSFLKGHQPTKPFQKDHEYAGGKGHYVQEAKARKWAEDAGVDWERLMQHEKDILVRCQRADAATALLDKGEMILGKYKAKPKASEGAQQESIVVELSAEHVGALKKSLKVLEELAGNAQEHPGS